MCLCVAALALSGLVVPRAAAATNFTWTGGAPFGESQWSNAANWGGTAPSGAVGTLTFPPLACVMTACGSNFDDIVGLSTSSLVVAGGYSLGGPGGGNEEIPLTVGSGGITFSGPESTRLAVPLALSSPQTWQINGGGGGGLTLVSKVKGEGVPLHLSLAEGGFLNVYGSGESNRGELVAGSTLVTGDGTINLVEAFVVGPVELQGVSLGANGANIFGSLTAKGSVVAVVEAPGVGRGLGVENLTLDPASALELTFSGFLAGAGSFAHAVGNVSLGGASLTLNCGYCDSSAGECPELTAGSEDDLVTADGILNGEFAGLPNGGIVSLAGCSGPHPPPTFRITYTPHAVIATVLGAKSPSVTTTSASSVSGTLATLNGTVTPNGARVTECYFQYGETSNVYGSRIPCTQAVGEGTEPVAVSAALAGLTPGTTYHFELVVATNGHGTVYGSDESFTTTGAAIPTVQTGYVYGGWPSNALLTGVINPHGNDVTYEFRYGAFSLPTVPSYSEILTGYWGSVAGSGALSGTTSQEVSASISGLAPHTPYYVRLVAFYDGLVTWGPEVRFEITPPEPEATEAPYLQVNGTDAAKGYRVRCEPGSWRYTNNNFAIRWVYVAQNGSTSAARSGAEKGNEYQVEQGDIGRPLACVVTPYKLDNHLATGPNTTLQSDLHLPEGTGLRVIPSWLKTTWNVISTAKDVPSAWDAGVWCGAAVLVPEIFAVECLTNATELILSNALQDALGSIVDPPEANYQSIALPHPHVEREHGKRPCPRNLRRGACGVLVRLAKRYAGATARATGIIEGIAISRNRTLIARKKRDSETLVVQEAARKVYFGLLTAAIDEQRKAGALFAEELRRLHADVRIPGARLRALPRHRGTAWESSLQRAMLTHGFAKAEVRKAFAARPTGIRGFDLVRSLLAIPAPPLAFTRYYDEISINDLMALVTGLARQDALRSSSVSQLFADLDRARAACTTAARASATQRLLADAKASLQVPSYSFLSTAAQPLIDGSSTVDPYPRCLG
jgi:hypothetical protein